MIVNKPKSKKKKLSRYTVLNIIMLIIFCIISLKLVYLQVYKHDDYEDRANQNATRFIAEKAPRGEILDKNGNVLATNKQTYTLTYTTTDEAQKKFYSTMDSIFKVLKENGESVQDDLLVKIDDKGGFYFGYKDSSPDNQQYEKLRFLKDRGMNEQIQRELFGDESKDLTDNQIAQIDQKLLKVTPEEAFYYLVKSYDLIGLVNPDPSKDEKKEYKDMTGKQLTDLILKKYSLNDIRDYMVVKDAIKMQSFKGYKAVTIASNIKKDTAFIIYQKLNDLPGIGVDLQPVREYPYKNLGSSVLGYVGTIDSSLEDDYKLRGYDPSTDLVGKSGIESAFEDELKGVKGGETVKVNSEGRKTEELFKLESYPGNNVNLTIDKNVQYAMQEALKDTINKVRTQTTDSDGHSFPNATRGAALAIDVNTGKILAMASYPDFDPNLFAIPGQLTKEQTEQYFSPDLEKFGKELIKKTGVKKSVDDLFPKDKNGYRTDPYDLYAKPFYNYATLGTLPPGSIFKPITAIAGLQEGVIKPGVTINATGKFNIHPETFGTGFGPVCWIYPGSHGPTDVERALQVSCNFFFYETAYRLYMKDGGNANRPEALNVIAKYAWKFGLGVDPNSKTNPSTGIEIEENTTGQTYNFKTFKESTIALSNFEIADFLEKEVPSGSALSTYQGTYNFIPFDFSYKDDDSEKVKNLKVDLKQKIKDRFEVVATGKSAMGQNEFAASILSDVKGIMQNSDVYKNNVKKYEDKYKKKANIDEQASTVSSAIARYVVTDKSAEMTSPGQVIYSAIGQGINHYTPLQLGAYISTLANGGTRYALHLVDSVTDVDGKVVEQFKPKVLDKVEMNPATLAAVKEGMAKVNDAEGGTASAVFSSFPIKTAGKTGTADYSNDQRDFGRSPYATYVSFAPIDKPEIAFVGVIYDGGHGSYTAPVAKAVYEAYFKDKILKDYPEYAKGSSTFKKYVLDAPKDNNEAAQKAEQEKADNKDAKDKDKDKGASNN
ncbi:penicillin-binding transpeptidase domain-containing protein [Clostridium sardiniense]